MSLDINVYSRNITNFADDDQLLNTGVSYPISFDKAIIYGAEGKLSLVPLGKLSGYASYSYSAGFDRCAISFVHQQTWQIFQIQINQQQPTVCDCGNRVCDFQAWRSLPDGNCRPVASSSDRLNRD